MSPRNAGFTLIELSITAAILGILASVSIGPMAGLVEQQRATTAISSLLTDIALTRTAAIARNRTAILCPSRDGHNCNNDTDWSSGWLLYIDENRNHQPDPGDEILRVNLRPDASQVRILGSNGRRQLRYRADGSNAGTNLTLSVCGHGHTLLGQVIVNNIGRPRSQRPRQPTACPN